MLMARDVNTGEWLDVGGEEMNELPKVISEATSGTFKEFATSKNTVLGLLIGLGIGAAVNVTQWWLNKKQREKMLAELTWTIDAFESALINNFSIADPSGKVVDVSAFKVENTDEFIATINREMYNQRKVLKGDERLKWLTALERLVKLSQKIQLEQVARHQE